MSGEINIAEIRGGEAELLVNEESHVLQSFPIFRDGFRDEFLDNWDRFSARSKDKRTYYVISNQGRKEALIGMRSHNSPVAEISGMGRLLKKPKNDTATLEGWRYLQVLLDKGLIPKGIRTVRAQLVTKGSLEAFEQFKKKCCGGHGKYSVDIRPQNVPTSKGTVRICFANISITDDAG